MRRASAIAASVRVSSITQETNPLLTTKRSHRAQSSSFPSSIPFTNSIFSINCPSHTRNHLTLNRRRRFVRACSTNHRRRPARVGDAPHPSKNPRSMIGTRVCLLCVIQQGFRRWFPHFERALNMLCTQCSKCVQTSSNVFPAVAYHFNAMVLPSL